ncbi:MAG: metal transporter [Xanthobacteraceae bacterium]
MNKPARPAAAKTGRSLTDYLWFAVPLVALVLATVWLSTSDWLRAFNVGAPPVEKLTFERTVLDSDGIHLYVRAGGSEPLTIAQVTVDDAFWAFTQDPPGALDRLATAWLHIPYPWVLGEAHEIKLRSGTGAAFTKAIEVAVSTPKPQIGQLQPQALLGAFVGIVPVAIGMLFFPALQSLGGRRMNFVLALTIGLLGFLFVDTLEEGLEMAGEAAAAFQGTTMVLVTAAVAFLVLMVIGRRHGTPTGLALATYIALGIGLHNFGEGLAIGAAFAAGIAGLGTFLVLGFTLHNVTEGIGIVAPLVDKRPPLWTFIGLALLAGAPAIPGLWLGSLSFGPHWSALALAIGAGAILQVIVEVGDYLKRHAERHGENWLSFGTLAGIVAGAGVMYVTAIFVKI